MQDAAVAADYWEQGAGDAPAPVIENSEGEEEIVDCVESGPPTDPVFDTAN